MRNPQKLLKNRGVEYIEVRALDVNPFSATGISVEQIRFLDIFLTFCLYLNQSPELTCSEQAICEKNMDAVVVRGRDPQLLLIQDHTVLNKSSTLNGVRKFLPS